jgi:AraC family transcriptional regulator
MMTADLDAPFAPIVQCAEFHQAPLGDFVVGECRANSGVRLAWHAHQHASLMLLLDGSVNEVFGDRTVACSNAVALFKPAGERHANEYGTAGARFLVVELPPAKLDELRDRGAQLDRVRTVQGPAVADLGFRLRRELRHIDEYSLLSIGGLVYELLAVMSRESRRGGGATAPRWLQEIHEELRCNFSHPVRIGDLASRLDVHPDYLSRSFRRHYGMLIGEYVRQLRIEWASKRLASTDTSLAEVAVAAGFADQSEFTRRFREQLGTTPGRYRAVVRQ